MNLDKYDILETLLREKIKGGNITHRMILIDMLDIIDDKTAERALKQVARNWGVDLNERYNGSDE